MDFLSSAPESASSTRLVKLVWFAALVAGWLYATVTSSPRVLAEIPQGVVWITGLVLGGSVGAKALEVKGQN